MGPVLDRSPKDRLSRIPIELHPSLERREVFRGGPDNWLSGVAKRQEATRRLRSAPKRSGLRTTSCGSATTDDKSSGPPTQNL